MLWKTMGVLGTETKFTGLDFWNLRPTAKTVWLKCGVFHFLLNAKMRYSSSNIMANL